MFRFDVFAKRSHWYVVLLLAQAARADGQSAHTFAEALEKAQGLGAWRSRPALECALEVVFGQTTLVEGTLLFDPHRDRVRIEQRGGILLVFDGSRAWVSPDTAQFRGARFHLRTWTYFLAAPFKLRDPGARLVEMGSLPLLGKDYPAARLTFDSGVGDTPEDWYVLYRDPQTNYLAAMAYIVTYGKDREHAEVDPHVVVFQDFTSTDGVALPTRWTFHHWKQETGAQGEPIGHVRLKNIRFVELEDSAFARPADAREDSLPAVHTGQ